MIDLFIKQNEAEKRFIETGEYDETDQQLKFMVELHRMNGNLDKLKKYISIEVAKNNQTINYYNESIETLRHNAKMNLTVKNHDMGLLYKKYKNKTVICVSFGASLMKNIEHLKKIQDKYIIIAVDRAIEYLHKHNVKVDYYITVDAFSSADWIPSDANFKGVKLLALIGGSHEFCKKFENQGGEVSFFQSIDRAGIWKEINEITGDMPYLTCSGNVGHAALIASLYLFEAKKTLLVGFDNSYNRYYYPDIENAEYDHRSTKTIDITGEETKTLDEFLSYNYFMQETINNKDVIDKVINCSEGGILHIKHLDKLENY